MLPVVHIVIFETVFVLQAKLTNQCSCLAERRLRLLDHRELNHDRVSLHVQVLVDEICERETSVHHLCLPIEVLLHETYDFAPTCHGSLLCKVGALDGVHDYGFPVDAL